MKILSRLRSCDFKIFVKLTLEFSLTHLKFLLRISESCPIKSEFVNDMELSKYLWALKANATDYNLKWSIKSNASKYKSSTRCDLCLTGKMIIALADPKVLLNKRTKLISKCEHRSKFILNSIK